MKRANPPEQAKRSEAVANGGKKSQPWQERKAQMPLTDAELAALASLAACARSAVRYHNTYGAPTFSLDPSFQADARKRRSLKVAEMKTLIALSEQLGGPPEQRARSKRVANGGKKA